MKKKLILPTTPLLVCRIFASYSELPSLEKSARPDSRLSLALHLGVDRRVSYLYILAPSPLLQLVPFRQSGVYALPHWSGHL